MYTILPNCCRAVIDALPGAFTGTYGNAQVYGIMRRWRRCKPADGLGTLFAFHFKKIILIDL